MSYLTARVFNKLKLLLLILVVMMTFAVTSAMAEEIEPALSPWVKIIDGNYKEKEQAINEIVELGDIGDAPALRAMLEGMLYAFDDTEDVYIMSETETGYRFSPTKIGDVKNQEDKSGFGKIRVNNRLRGLLRKSLAVFQLKDPSADLRRSAVEELLKYPDGDTATLVRTLVVKEKNAEVRELMDVLLAINQLLGDDEYAQAEAINTLKDSLNPSALNALNRFETNNLDLRKQAKLAIDSIHRQQDFYSALETVFFGLSLGSVLALAGLGLAITFGVMGVINMAHGEMMMIGAYTTFVIQQVFPDHIGLSIIIAIPAAFVAAGAVGVLIERGVIRFLYGRPLETLLATFGVSLILQQAARSIFSPLNQTVETPAWMSGVLQVNDVLALTWNRLYIILFCVAVFVTLIAVMKKTSLGLQVRAVSQNRAMARAMGVRSEWVDALTFGLGSGVAGVAGVALSLLTNVGPNLGQAYIIDSFLVVVFGGVGNLWGTMIAGISLGVFNKILEPWAGAVLAKILVLVFIILFIQKRPKGLFPQRGRAAED